MKKLLTILLAAVALYGCQRDILREPQPENSPATRASTGTSEHYYWLGNEKIPLEKIDNKFYVIYEPSNEGKLEAELAKTGIKIAEKREELDILQFVTIKNFDTKKFSGLKTATIEGSYEKIAATLSHAYYVAPYYKTDIGEGRLTNRFSIALKHESDVKILAELAEKNSVELLGVSELDGWYELACSNLSSGNSLEMANMFYETGLFESVSYDLGARGSVESINEPLYTNGILWHLGNNTTNSNIHINYIAARGIVPQASSSVKIAVIDSGVQYGHSDFYNVSPGWNAETQSSPNVVTNPHGTQVTGFIAARPNNGEAVAGVAYGATVYPVSFTVASSGTAILSSAEVMVRAVNHAVSEGAKVINCSWIYSDNRVVNAVKGALDSGCIVVFLSGNNYGAVSSPANSDSRIIVVGGINKSGARASFSNYGSQLDIVAPGDALASTTTGSGYAYEIGISGTSFAAPQVAGIAALLLSAYPGLSQQEVVGVISRTANQLDGYGTSNKEYGPWNEETGYGLVDAYAALSSITPFTSAGSIYLYQTGSAPIEPGTVPPPMGSSTVAVGGSGLYSWQWQASSDGVTWANITGANSTNYAYPHPIYQTMYFRRKATSVGTVLYSNVIAIQVNQGTLQGGFIFYSGGIPTVSRYVMPNTIASSQDASGGTGSYTYSWEYCIGTGDNTGTTWIPTYSSSGGNYYQFSGSISQTQSYRRKVTSGNATAYSNTVTLTVY